MASDESQTTAKRNTEIARRMEAGARQVDLARAYNLSPTRIAQIVRKEQRRKRRNNGLEAVSGKQ